MRVQRRSWCEGPKEALVMRAQRTKFSVAGLALAVMAVASFMPKATATVRCPFGWDGDGDITSDDCFKDVAKLNSRYNFGSNELYCGGTTINSRRCSNAISVLMGSGDFEDLRCDGAYIEATNGDTCEQQIKKFNAILNTSRQPRVVVTGKTNGGLSGRDVATIKIDTVGSEDTVDIALVQATPADDDHCT
eukprot:gene18993-32319_t